MDQSSELASIIRAGAFLVDSTQTTLPSDLRDLLVSRLVQYHASLGHDQQYTHSTTLEEIQLETAKEALSVVEKVQQILHTDSFSVSGGDRIVGPSEPAPAIGTRDLAKLRTLLSITFKWGVEPLLTLVTSAWPSKPSPMLLSGPKIIDLTTTPEDYRRLSSFLVRILALLLPGGFRGCLPQTLITTILLNRHLADVLKPCIALGWLPKSLSSEGTPTLDEIRPKIMRLFEILPPSQTISALGAVLSGAPLPVAHVRKSCASLLSRQLLRPEGVVGLCAAVFGEGEDSETNISLEKLEHIAKVLSAVPIGMKPEEYLHVIVPRIIAILSNPSPLTHRRAAAFTLSRMLATDGSYKYQSFVVTITSGILHDPFLRIRNTTEHELSPPPSIPLKVSYDLTPTAALSTLMTFILHADPSPTLISILLSPIMPALYALSAYIDRLKTTDPLLKESVKGLLATWGRVVESEECFDALWRVLESEGGDWESDIAGDIKKVKKSENAALSLLTPEDLRRAEHTGELDFDSNLLDLRPDPVHFVRFLKSVDRTDVSSEFFVKLLETYRDAKVSSEVDPIRTMLYLQLIIQMQTQLSESTGSSNILNKPEHILSFIKHALDSTTVAPSQVNRNTQRKTEGSLNLKDLRIASEEDDFLGEGDSDDEMPEGTGIPVDDEMTATAINLLLAILEVNGELSARTAPVLNDIFSLLEPLANNSLSVQGLAREARMVMTARLASVSGTTSFKSRSKNADEEKARNTYQQALKLLQDPILPVRAHGLLLLRQLVSPSSAKMPDSSFVDPALIPSIMSIFMQAIQDDDSYMFLNAVQGLVAMVETFGKDVLKGLVAIYSENLDGLAGTTLTQNDVDKRIRIGEALSQVVRRLGDALGIYVDIIVPPLTHVFRSHHIPTTLRTSALSLLSECANSSSSAFLPYAVDLSNAMVDLLQIETVPVAIKPRQPPTEGEEMEEGQSKATMDSQPTSTDSKLPPLRRAGLHFLALLLRASTTHVYGRSHQGNPFSRAQLSHAKTTLAYVASTDEDSIVRMMAREVIENIDQLNDALVGL